MDDDEINNKGQKIRGSHRLKRIIRFSIACRKVIISVMVLKYKNEGISMEINAIKMTFQG